MTLARNQVMTTTLEVWIPNSPANPPAHYIDWRWPIGKVEQSGHVLQLADDDEEDEEDEDEDDDEDDDFDEDDEGEASDEDEDEEEDEEG